MLNTIKRLFHREPDFVVGGKENPYLLRWWIIPRNRFLNIYLHKFLRDDDDRALHDHPWWSLSLTLAGQYVEQDDHGRRTYRRGAIRLRPATYRHRIELVEQQPAWTLFVTGPRVREWGFHCPQGWRHWKDFVSKDGTEIGNGCN